MQLTAALLAFAVGLGGPFNEQDTKAGTPNTIRLPEDASRPQGTVSQVAWLTGRWQGEGLGGSVEEAWSDPAGGAMVGYFRLVKDGKPVFYEILTIIEVEGSLELRLKHLNPDMTGWEEKASFVTFKLARIEPEAVYFNGLTFRKAGKDRIEIYLALRSAGVVREEKFTMARRPGAP